MRAIALLAALIAISGYLRAETITRCGASKGKAYYFESPFFPKGEAGWVDDGITGGSLTLTQTGDGFDLVSTNQLGETLSAREDGFDVIRVPNTQRNVITIVALNRKSGAVEHYLFNLDATGVGEVAWGTLRGGNAPKSSLYLAECSRR